MLIERIELRLLELPLVEPFAAAHGTTTTREIVVVRVETDLGSGWGECAALPEPTYNDEFAAGAFVILDEELAPRLMGHDLEAATVRHRLAVVAGDSMAKAALEMAVLDIELRSRAESLASWLGSTAADVPAGVAVGLGPIEQVVDRVAALANDGFGRVKLKIRPGHDLELVAAVRLAVSGVELHLDANGSYRREHLDLLVEVAESGVSALEQPFPPGQLDVAARLVDRSPVPVVADEAAESRLAVEQLRQAGALSGVSIKPSRLGGLLPARDLHDACVEADLPATAGGMIETGLGRHALAALAALPGFTLTGDLSPARRWLAADPWPDLEMRGGRIAVPTGPGVAPGPDDELVERYTAKRSELTL
jgi:O-succinylbenzoate synthase